MINSKQSRRTKKKTQIIQTAEKLFSRYGSKRISVEEICRESWVSKMTFYKYFSNKLALVRSIKDMYVEEGFRKFDEINALDIEFPEKIDLMSRWKVEFGARISADFIREMVSIDDDIEETKN